MTRPLRSDGVTEDATPREQHVPSFPLADMLGMTTTLVRPGQTMSRVTLDERHHNPNGMVHGGVLFTLVDTGMGHATTSLLDAGQVCASVEIQIRFLRALRAGTVEAETSVLRRGGRVVHLESRVHDDEGSLVATATGTFLVITT
jgi:acyl-CoA thioesterase